MLKSFRASRILPLFLLPSAAFSRLRMQVIRNDTQGGRGVTLVPPSGLYSKVVLFFHGLGDTADGWASLMGTLNMEDTKFILPTAPVRPITLNMGMSMTGWSDILGLHPNSDEDSKGFEESAERVNRIIQSEIDGGISPSKILIGGFSQGGALALHVSLRSKYPLAGCVGLSTWVPLRKDYPNSLSESAKSIPIIQGHGDADQVVPYAWGKASHEMLKGLVPDANPKFMTFHGMGHSDCPEELVMFKNFLVEKLQ